MIMIYGGLMCGAVCAARGTLGEAMGWLMALLYMLGRVPQIIKNARRGSTEGLSMWMFVLAVAANTSYLASILVRCVRLDLDTPLTLMYAYLH